MTATAPPQWQQHALFTEGEPEQGTAAPRPTTVAA